MSLPSIEKVIFRGRSCVREYLLCLKSFIMSVNLQPATEMQGGQYQAASPKFHHCQYSLTDSSFSDSEDEEAEAPPPLTPLQKLTTDMCKNEKTIKELIIGRRVGFYKVRGEIGCGTFSRVKMAFHALAKGKTTITLLLPVILSHTSTWK